MRYRRSYAGSSWGWVFDLIAHAIIWRAVGRLVDGLPGGWAFVLALGAVLWLVHRWTVRRR